MMRIFRVVIKHTIFIICDLVLDTLETQTFQREYRTPFFLSRKLQDPRFCESSGHCLSVTGPTQLGLIPRNKKKHDEEPDQTEMTNFQGHVSGELHPLGSRLTHPLLCQESSKITDTRYCDDTVGTHPRWSRV